MEKMDSEFALAERAEATSTVAIVGVSAEIQQVWKQVEMFAPTNVSMLLMGESGTGKELFARAIHSLSRRASGPFIEVDCASLPESLIEAELFGHEKGAFTDAKEARKGKFELASGGTLFLDELGNLSPNVQSKLLRLVQERVFRRVGGTKLVEADVRIVSATNADLSQAMEKQTFRSDLFYRLAEMPIALPPLRERHGDLPVLFDHFVTDYNVEFGKHVRGGSEETMELLRQHTWPGNVRELKNVARAGAVQAEEVIEPEHLPPGFPRGCLLRAPGPDRPGAGRQVDPFAEGVCDEFAFRIPWAQRQRGLDLKTLHQLVRHELDRRILTTLRGAGLNKTQISRYLGLDYKVLLEKFKELGLG